MTAGRDRALDGELTRVAFRRYAQRAVLWAAVGMAVLAGIGLRGASGAIDWRSEAGSVAFVAVILSLGGFGPAVAAAAMWHALSGWAWTSYRGHVGVIVPWSAPLARRFVLVLEHEDARSDECFVVRAITLRARALRRHSGGQFRFCGDVRRGGVVRCPDGSLFWVTRPLLLSHQRRQLRRTVARQ